MYRRMKQNAQYPLGLMGSLLMTRMNHGRHAAMAAWGLAHLRDVPAERILEIGCGGGANIARLLKIYPKSQVTGVDLSGVSVRKSRHLNRRAVRRGRCQILQGNVAHLPAAEGQFDLATAFETIYFWPDFCASCQEVARVLRAGGSFLICNETDGERKEDHAVEEQISHCKVYRKEEIQEALWAAGFTRIRCAVHPDQRWMVMLAQK